MGDTDRNFWLLCRVGNIEGVQAAIDNGADVNETYFETYLGATGLMGALYRNHNNVVQVLLQHPQININKVGLNGWVALHWAVFGDNHEGMAAVLAQDDQSINQRNRFGRTPIMNAVRWNSVNCFQLLLTNPLVDLDTRDDYERTPEQIRR